MQYLLFYLLLFSESLGTIIELCMLRGMLVCAEMKMVQYRFQFLELSKIQLRMKNNISRWSIYYAKANGVTFYCFSIEKSHAFEMKSSISNEFFILLTCSRVHFLHHLMDRVYWIWQTWETELSDVEGKQLPAFVWHHRFIKTFILCRRL